MKLILIGLFIGFGLAIVLYFLTIRKSNKQIRAEKESVEKQYQLKVAAIEQERDKALKALNDAEAKIANMTDAEAREKLTAATNSTIDNIKQTTVQNIMNEVKKSAQ